MSDRFEHGRLPDGKSKKSKETYGRDTGERSERHYDPHADQARADGAPSRHELGIRKRRAITRGVVALAGLTIAWCLPAHPLEQSRGALHQRAVDTTHGPDGTDDAAVEAVNEAAGGLGGTEHGRERPVGRSHGEVVRGHVFERRQEGRDGAARHAAAQGRRGRAGAERGAAERFAREVDDRV